MVKKIENDSLSNIHFITVGKKTFEVDCRRDIYESMNYHERFPIFPLRLVTVLFSKIVGKRRVMEKVVCGGNILKGYM